MPGKIQRSVQLLYHACLADSLQVFERSHLVFREQGAVIEEADEDEDDGGEPESFDEKDGLREKIALHLQDQQRSVSLTDMHPGANGGAEMDVR